MSQQPTKEALASHVASQTLVGSMVVEELHVLLRDAINVPETKVHEVIQALTLNRSDP
jgi:hypothetical protein